MPALLIIQVLAPGSKSAARTNSTRISRNMLRYAFALLAPVPFLVLPALLQAGQATAPTGPACMARPETNQDVAAFVIKVPASAQNAMAARGFASRPCAGDQNAFERYRSRMCHLANDAPIVVQNQFTQKNNVTPRELCDLATQVSEL